MSDTAQTLLHNLLYLTYKKQDYVFSLPFIKKQIAKMSFQNPVNFANYPKEEVKNIASRKIRATGSHFAPDRGRASEAGIKGGNLSSRNFVNLSEHASEPGDQNFSDDDLRRITRAKEAGRKGGKASGHNIEQETD
ncbi:hypothetical protein CU097_013594 [Rhizopus azygosporus]|uniref:Uncharacterized protein n=1 Tax=Rhizopus azygosporus TaxID=86630 RepID=A0A367KF06_RHIAZ|nr:hypothetical protein CU097_013594 [Rhizopus azygosporus]